MNARQRRLRRRVLAPVVLSLIDGVEAAALCMEETGQPLTPQDCRAIADGLREMVARNPDWESIARGDLKAKP